MHSAASYFTLPVQLYDIIVFATFEIYMYLRFIPRYYCVVLISSLSVDISFTHWDY